MNAIIEIKSVTIIMPTYNEAGNIADLIRDSVSCVKELGVSEVEVIVVDDDSPDQTWKVAMEVCCPDARVRVIRRMENHGLTASINEGIAAAQMDVIVWLDGDFSHPPVKIPQLLYMISQGFDVVVNSRYVLGGGEIREGNGGRIQIFLSRAINLVIRFLLDSAFYDYTSGFVAVRRKVFSGDMRLRGDYGEYFTDFMFHVLRNKQYKVCELPYIMQARRSGESKTGSNIMHFMKRGIKYILTIIRLRLGLR